MKDNIDNIGDYLGQCMDMFFWDYISYKNTPSVRATKINKNQGFVFKTIGVNLVVNFCCILKYFLYLCTRFTSKVWIKTEIYVVTNTVIDVPSPYFLHPKTG